MSVFYARKARVLISPIVKSEKRACGACSRALYRGVQALIERTAIVAPGLARTLLLLCKRRKVGREVGTLSSVRRARLLGRVRGSKESLARHFKLRTVIVAKMRISNDSNETQVKGLILRGRGTS